MRRQSPGCSEITSERLEDVVRERYLRLPIRWSLVQHPGLSVTFYVLSLPVSGLSRS